MLWWRSSPTRIVNVSNLCCGRWRSMSSKACECSREQPTSGAFLIAVPGRVRPGLLCRRRACVRKITDKCHCIISMSPDFKRVMIRRFTPRGHLSSNVILRQRSPQRKFVRLEASKQNALVSAADTRLGRRPKYTTNPRNYFRGTPRNKNGHPFAALSSTSTPLENKNDVPAQNMGRTRLHL